MDCENLLENTDRLLKERPRRLSCLQFENNPTSRPPERLFVDRSSVVKFTSLENDVGIGPFSLFSPTSTTSSKLYLTSFS